MEEAERLCDRVAVFDLGKVIALGTPGELIATLGAEHVIELRLGESVDAEAEHQWLRGMDGVGSLDVDGDRTRITVAEPHTFLPELFNEIQRRDLELTGLTTRHASLEDVFVHLTGRHLTEQ
jgi:ABC-2 type transport system ATP-binding protein